MQTLKLNSLFNLLVQIPDVQDVVIKNSVFCVKTDSNDYVKIDFTKYSDKFVPGSTLSENMTLSDFGAKYKTVKLLSDNFSKDVEFNEEDNWVTFIFDQKQIFRSRIPILNNEFSLEEWNELFQQNEFIGELTITKDTFIKIKGMLELYKANPWIELNDNSKLDINVVSSNKSDKISFEVSDNVLGDYIKEPIKLQKIMFNYPFSSDVKLKFFKMNNNLIVYAQSTIADVEVEYAFITALEMNLSIEAMGIDIDGINLDL